MTWWRKLLGIFGYYRKGAEASLPGKLPGKVGEGSLSTRFDPLFRKYAEKVPIEYMRALAYSESKMNPAREQEKEIDIETRRLPDGKKDSYWGLFQVGVTNVLADYNERHGTNIQPVQLFDPDTNTRLAADTLNRIVEAYDSLGVPALRMNWNDLEYVKLVTAGWNSGYSRSGGLQKVARYLQEKGIPVTHNNVFKHAKEAGATKYLDGVGTYEGVKGYYDKKRKWQAAVAARYFREQGRIVAESPDSDSDTKPPGGTPSGGGQGPGPLVAAGLFFAAGLALAAQGKG